MKHALIVNDNLVVSRAIRDRLVDAGFSSFDIAWSRNLALRAVARRQPDLVVVGLSIADGEPIEVAELIARSNDLPMLIVTADHFALRRSLPAGAALEGPFGLNQVNDALLAMRAAA